MKKLLFVLAAITTLSCSKDDDKNETSILLPVTTPLATKIITDGDPGDNMDRVLVLSYDNNQHMTQVVVTGDITRTYAITYYANNLPSTVTITGDNPGVQVITYDSDQRLATSSFEGTTTTFTYNSATDILSAASLQFGFNAIGDVRFFDALVFNYDNSKYGPMTNAAMSYHMMSVILDSAFFYFGSRKPITTLTTGAVPTYTFANTYNSAGYLTRSTVVGLQNLTVDVEYTDM